MKKEFVFQLDNAIKISKQGNYEETATIVFSPPSLDSNDVVSDFEQLFMGSLISAGNLFDDGKKAVGEIEPGEDDKSAMQALKDSIPEPGDMRLLLTVSQKIKLKDLVNSFKKVAFKTAEVDVGTPMKLTHINQMSRDEVIRMLCEYSSFFIFPSLLGGKLEGTSGSGTSAT